MAGVQEALVAGVEVAAFPRVLQALVSGVRMALFLLVPWAPFLVGFPACSLRRGCCAGPASGRRVLLAEVVRIFATWYPGRRLQGCHDLRRWR